MLIVDSQVHIWAANTPERPWAPGHWSQEGQPFFSREELSALMKGAGVDACVIVPPTLEGDRNDLALAAAQAAGRTAARPRRPSRCCGASSRPRASARRARRAR